MNAVDPIRRLHQHRSSVNERLLSVAETLSDEALQRSLPIGAGVDLEVAPALVCGGVRLAGNAARQ